MSIGFIEPRPGMSDDKPKPGKHLKRLKEINFAFGNVSLDDSSVRGRAIATLPINGFVPSTDDVATDWKEIRAAIGDIFSGIADSG